MRGSVNKGLNAYNAGDYETALARWLPKARAGDAAAQNNMGLLYEDGLTIQTAKSDLQAADWYILAAQQGLVTAMDNLARVQRRLGYIEAAESWVKMASDTRLQQAQQAALQQAQQAAVNQQQAQQGMASLGYALGCALAGGCATSTYEAPAQSSGAFGSQSYYLRSQWWDAGKRMCQYANNTVLNAGNNSCPETVLGQ